MYDALDEGQSVEAKLLEWIEHIRDLSYEKHLKCGQFGASLIDDGDGILTMCFAETSLLMTLAIAKQQGKTCRSSRPKPGLICRVLA